MFKVMFFLSLFVAVMVYRMVVIYHNQGDTMPKFKTNFDDENAINDPGMFWHPLNNYRD